MMFLTCVDLHLQVAEGHITSVWEEERAEGAPEETMSGTLFALSKLEFKLYKHFSEAERLQRQK